LPARTQFAKKLHKRKATGPCAAFAQALFGPDLVPDDADPEGKGAFAHDAFQVARVFMEAGRDGPGYDLLMSAAVVAHRDTERRRQETPPQSA
jgi:hypothetical protein